MSSGKKIVLFLERWGLSILVALLSLSFVLAIYETAEPGIGWLNAVADTLKSDAENSEGWTGYMHLMFKFVLAWAGVRVYMATAGLKWDNFAARHLMRNHVVIAAGKMASDKADTSRSGRLNVDKADLAVELAMSISSQGDPVVLCLEGLDDGRRHRLWGAGVTILDREFGVEDFLRASRISRARILIAMYDDYRQNIALVSAAVSRSQPNSNLQCKCMIEPLSLRRKFHSEYYLEPETLSRVRIFNEAELISRRILRLYPPDRYVAQSDTARVHVLLVGLGSIGQALLVQLAKTGHYRSGLHPKATIVDRQVSRQWSNLVESFPTLQRWIEVELIESHIEDLKPTRVKEWLYDNYPVSMAYVTTSDEVANLKVARMLISNLQNFREEKSAPVTEVVVVDPPGGYVLSDYETNGSHNGNIRLFSLARGGQRESKESFLSYLDDSRAKAMHAAYLRHNEKCPPDDPTWQTGASNASWDKLPEFLRESNRQLADLLDFEVKLRSIGCQLVTKGQDGPVQLRQYELDQLSRLEHQRWWSERELDGWQYSERSNRDLKLSSKMVDFDQLSPKDKGLDEKAVTDLISQLADEGLIVVRA